MAYVFGTLSGNAEIKNVIFSSVTVADPVGDAGIIEACEDNVNLENIQINNCNFTAGNGYANPLTSYAQDNVTISDITVRECNVGGSDGAFGIFNYLMDNVIASRLSSIKNRIVSADQYSCGIGYYLIGNCILQTLTCQNNTLYAVNGEVQGVLNFVVNNVAISDITVENCALSCDPGIDNDNISGCINFIGNDVVITNITSHNINLAGTNYITGCIIAMAGNSSIAGVVDIKNINVSITGTDGTSSQYIGGFGCQLAVATCAISTSLITIEAFEVHSSKASIDVSYCGGFAGSLVNQTLNKVYILDCSINGNDGSDGPFAGEIQNCALTNCGVITGGAQCLGTIAGFSTFINNSNLSKCFVVCTLSGLAIDAVSYGYGGFAGVVLNSNLSNCYAVINGTVVTDPASPPICGGFVGVNVGTNMTNCYVAGSYFRVLAVNLEGGFCGLQGAGSGINSSYWDAQSMGLATSDGGTGKTTAQMKVQDTFVGWNFASVWSINPKYNDGYPILKGSYYPLTGGGFAAAPTGITQPGISTGAATGISEQAAILNADLYDDGNVGCEVYFEYGLTSAYGNKTRSMYKVQGQEIEDFATGLSPGASYHYRAVAKNSAGVSYGVDKNFNTPSYEKVSFMGVDSILTFIEED